MSQELLGLCVIRLRAVLASLRLSASVLLPTSAPVGCWAAGLGDSAVSKSLKPMMDKSGDQTPGLSPHPQAFRETLSMSCPSLNHSFLIEERGWADQGFSDPAACGSQGDFERAPTQTS